MIAAVLMTVLAQNSALERILRETTGREGTHVDTIACVRADGEGTEQCALNLGAEQLWLAPEDAVTVYRLIEAASSRPVDPDSTHALAADAACTGGVCSFLVIRP